jgi:GNAT superfamily N-acetyltransferase
MTLTITRIAHQLPTGFDALRVDAEADGHRHMTRFAQEFEASPALFHAVFVGLIDGQLAGLGAITDEPTLPSQPVWRMRRVYVHRAFRRRDVARAIALALLQEAQGRVTTLTVHAGTDEAARFWEAMGFRPTIGTAWSHEFLTKNIAITKRY